MAIDKEVEPVLIAYVKENILQFCSETFTEIISKAGSRPVSILSFSHPNQEHKNLMLSESLNYLHNYDIIKDGEVRYRWKSDINSGVKGFYLSLEPMIIRKSCQEVAVFLMECNFCFNEKTATREDLMLFALNVLLSSTLIHSIGAELSESLLEFIQLFVKYTKGGIGADLSDSSIHLALLFNDWKLVNHYPYGYHDTGTCPLNGDRMINYRKDRLRLDYGNQSDFAFRNQFFVDMFRKICFGLMPGKDLTDEKSKPMPTFGDVFRRMTGRLFHPSNISVKRFNNQKISGYQMKTIFERISQLSQELNVDQDFELAFRDVKALSNGLNFYKFQMNKLVDNDKYLEDIDLKYLHDQCRKNALKLFSTVRRVDQISRSDKFDLLFDSEVESVWHLYQDLNQFKRQTLKTKGQKKEIIEHMLEEVLLTKKEFDGRQNSLDLEISRLVCLNLNEVTNAVRTAIGQ